MTEGPGVGAPRGPGLVAPDAAGVAAAARALAAGRLVGLPTETVYGLAADARSGAAVAAAFATKGRPRFNPLIVHAADLAGAARHGRIEGAALALAGAFWPGPLTLVVPWREGSGVHDLARAGLGSVALRVPAHPVARAVIAAFGGPVAAPSANRSGRLSPTRAADVAADLGDAVALVLDAGPCAVGVESTVVALLDGTPRLLRAGGLAREAIEAALGRALEGPRPGAVTAPGMLAAHYAPRAPLRANAAQVRPGEALLTFAGARLPGDAGAPRRDLSPGGDLAEAAANLFVMLRQLDALAPAAIAAAPVPGRGLGEAINDRLARGAAARG